MSLQCRQLWKKGMLLKQYFNLRAFLCHELSSILNSEPDKKINLAILQHLGNFVVISKGMTGKIVKSGWYCQHLN